MNVRVAIGKRKGSSAVANSVSASSTVPIKRDAFGYCNLDGPEAMALKRLIMDYTEWRALAQEYDNDGKGSSETRFTLMAQVMQQAFDMMYEYFPVVLHYPSGGADIFGTQYRPGAYSPRER